MMTPEIHVVNKHHGTKGIYIGRGSPLGNPYVIDANHSRDWVINEYRAYLKRKIHSNDHKICTALNLICDEVLKGPVNLVCYCAPKPCHGDVIKEFILTAIGEITNGRKK